MAGSTSKDLTARVKIDIKQAEASLRKLNTKLNNINTNVNKLATSSNKVTTNVNKINTSVNKLSSNTNKLTGNINKLKASTNGLAQARLQLGRTGSMVTSGYKKSGSAIGVLTGKLKGLAAAYLGVMGARAIITTSDTITSAENKLNYMNNNSDMYGSQATGLSMDKMFTSAQKVRMGYTDMMSNVSKSMVLAPNAFGKNIDNAIRFQEIMAEAYTIGGASAAEMHSSMYQLIQALGSGTLQGDELRSVREGASVAYKEIEKYAQALYKSNDSLKDMASQGMITSDIVVAAITQAGDTIDREFEKTAMTFAQAFTKIKNVAIVSFQPVLRMLNQALNSDVGQAIINGICFAIQFVAGAIHTLFKLIAAVYNFIVEHWAVIRTVLIIIATIIAVVLIPLLWKKIMYLIFVAQYYIYVGACAVKAALSAIVGWMAANWVLALVIIVLLAIIGVIAYLAESFTDACGMVMGGIYVVGAVFYNVVAFMINLIMGLLEYFGALATNIYVYFANAFTKARIAFWSFVSDCLNGTGKIAQAVSKIAELFGLDAVSIDTKINAAKGDLLDPVDTNQAWINGINTLEFKNLNDAYQNGYKWGSSKGQWITDKVNGIGNKIKKALNISDIPNVGLNTTPVTGPGGLGNLGDIGKNTGKTADNTGKIADAVALTAEDLEYLRKIANQEWKKEFTTANITVDMKNYNEIKGDNDLDGVVTKLVNKLYEELESVADGVYV